MQFDCDCQHNSCRTALGVIVFLFFKCAANFLKCFRLQDSISLGAGGKDAPMIYVTTILVRGVFVLAVQTATNPWSWAYNIDTRGGLDLRPERSFPFPSLSETFLK